MTSRRSFFLAASAGTLVLSVVALVHRSSDDGTRKHSDSPPAVSAPVTLADGARDGVSRTAAHHPLTTRSRPGTLAEAISNLHAAFAVGPTGDDWGAAIGDLVHLGREAELEMIRQVSAGVSGNELRAAAEVLARIGRGDGIEALVVRLWKAGGEDRDLILAAFALIDTEEGINLLASAYSATEDPEILDHILRNLARAATGDTVDFLHEMYREDERIEGQRSRILSAVELVGAPEAIPALAELLAAPGEPELNLSAARALAKSGSIEGLIALSDEAMRRIGAGRPDEAAAALEGIASFRGESGRGMLEQLADAEHHAQELSKAAAQALASLPPREELEGGEGRSGDPLPRPSRRTPPKVRSAN
jgi:hypothetical protein